MQIELKEIAVKELAEGYKDNAQAGDYGITVYQKTANKEVMNYLIKNHNGRIGR